MDNKGLEAAARAAFDVWWNNRGAGAEVSWLSTKQQWIHQQRAAIASYEAARETGWRSRAKFKLGERVTKTRGSSWTGLIVGVYETSLTPIGYCVESENEPGSVQLYPEAALAAAPLPEQEPRP